MNSSAGLKIRSARPRERGEGERERERENPRAGINESALPRRRGGNRDWNPARIRAPGIMTSRVSNEIPTSSILRDSIARLARRSKGSRVISGRPTNCSRPTRTLRISLAIIERHGRFNGRRGRESLVLAG